MIATTIQRDETPHTRVVILTFRVQEGRAVWYGTLCMHHDEILENVQESYNEEDAMGFHVMLFRKHLLAEFA